MKAALTTVLVWSLLLGGHAAAAAALSPRADQLTFQERIDAQYQAARERCHTLAGNAQDVCYAEARARQRIDRTAVAARVENTPRAHYDAQVAQAEAEYQVAKERCNGRGSEKDPCVREAEEAEWRAKAKASAELRAAEDQARR